MTGTVCSLIGKYGGVDELHRCKSASILSIDYLPCISLVLRFINDGCSRLKKGHARLAICFVPEVSTSPLFVAILHHTL